MSDSRHSHTVLQSLNCFCFSSCALKDCVSMSSRRCGVCKEGRCLLPPQGPIALLLSVSLSCFYLPQPALSASHSSPHQRHVVLILYYTLSALRVKHTDRKYDALKNIQWHILQYSGHIRRTLTKKECWEPSFTPQSQGGKVFYKYFFFTGKIILTLYSTDLLINRFK